MITEKEFLNAIDIVRTYQIQTNAWAKIIENSKKTLISEFIKTKVISARLYYVLKLICDEDSFADSKNVVRYIEDVKKKDILIFRNVGNVTWQEFEDLREKL